MFLLKRKIATRFRGASVLPTPSMLPWSAGIDDEPSVRLSSIIRLSPTTSVANFLFPSLSSQLLVRKRPSIYTRLPLWRYFWANSAKPRQSTTVCHSVCETNLPERSLKVSVVANGNFATPIFPSRNYTSGSFPRLPMSITLFTPLILFLFRLIIHLKG